MRDCLPNWGKEIFQIKNMFTGTFRQLSVNHNKGRKGEGEAQPGHRQTAWIDNISAWTDGGPLK